MYIYIYIYIYLYSCCCWRSYSKVTRNFPFQLLLHRGVGKGATPFAGLLHFTLDTYLILLSVKQRGIK